MIQVLNKWKIVIHFEHKNDLMFYIHDNHIQNVLRKLADISYDGINQEIGIDIELVK